ncbi:hypothetical protein [Janthinobacterium sp. P210006]|uniref:hypothetical protein n=1 Tax=Janthinobacterium sp. P210006 TaxID=3112939 RepID=UPI002E272842|nr:hypothetical protein [Janthinobacterium sp. P210006]
MNSSQTYAMRTADGGLKGVKVDDIIGCNVSLSEVEGHLMVLVKARNVNSEPITLDKEGVLVVAPVEKVAVWEKSVDMTKQDRFEFDTAETKLGFSVIVGIQRID